MTYEESVRQSGIRVGEARGIKVGEARGELRGIIQTLRDTGKSPDYIIQYLTTRKNNPFTKAQAVKALKEYDSENGSDVSGEGRPE